MFKNRYFESVLVSLLLLSIFFINVSSSPLPAKTQSEENGSADNSGDEESPVFDMEYSDTLDDEEGGENDTTSVRSRRHDGEPKFFKLFCRVGLYLEMFENGTLRGTGEDGSEKGRLFEIPAMPGKAGDGTDLDEIVTIRSQDTKKYIAIDENGEITTTDIETPATRFIRRKNEGAYKTLASFIKFDKDSTLVYLGMNREGECSLVDENSASKNFLFVEADTKKLREEGKFEYKKDDS